MLLITNGICHRPVHTLCNRLQSGGIVDVDPLLISRLKSGVFANGAHGFGHIFMYLMGGNTGTYIKLSLDPLAVANICMLSMFWIGTLRSVVANLKTTHATVMSAAVLIIQYMLDVPPNLAFTYSQAVILSAGSFDQLIRRDEYAKSGCLYFAYALYHLPLQILYAMEMFICQDSILANLGGHFVYDLYLSIIPFVLYYVIGGDKKLKKVD